MNVLAASVKPAFNLKGGLLALTATGFWSGNFVVGRLLAGQVPPVTLACLRWIVAILVLWALFHRDVLREWPLLKKHWRYYLLTSFTGISVVTTLYYLAAESTNVLNMTLIATFTPIFTLLLARFCLGEALSRLRAAGILLAFGGVLLLAVRGQLGLLRHLHFQSGDLISLAAALIFAVYTIQLRYQPAGLSPGTFITATFTLGLVMLLPFLAWELGRTPPNLGPLGPMAWVAIIYAGLGAAVGGFWCWNKAVAAMGPGNAALCYYTLPFFGALEGVFLFGEPVLWVHLVSGACIFGGILLASLSYPGQRFPAAG